MTNQHNHLNHVTKHCLVFMTANNAFIKTIIKCQKYVDFYEKISKVFQDDFNYVMITFRVNSLWQGKKHGDLFLQFYEKRINYVDMIHFIKLKRPHFDNYLSVNK